MAKKKKVKFIDKLKKVGWKKWVFIIACIPFLLVLSIFLLVRFGGLGELPTAEEMSEIRNPVSSSLLDADGKLITEYYIENRTNVELEDISPYFLDALIATEDARFYKHGGVDYRSLGRVAIKSILLQRGSSGGGSTLTQQLVKNVFKRKSYGILTMPVNKFSEFIAAHRLENIYSKKEILKLFVNTVSFGERAFGINTASNRFFNKAPKDLTLAESATLVGILKGTSLYSPRRNPERAKIRRNVVLSQMYKYEYITEEVKNMAQAEELTLEYMSPQGERLIAYAKNHVKKEFEKVKNEFPKADGTLYNLYTDGLKIYTTLDKQLQRDAENIVAKTMPDIQKQFFAGWAKSSPFKGSTRAIDDAIHKHPIYKRLKAQGKSKEEILKPFTTKASRRVWTWEGYEEKEITIIDSIKHYLTLLQSGMMAVDPNDGAIKVWVGGNDFGEFQYDNVSSARQVGSTFKPITYLLALEKGIDPCTFYPNELRTYVDYKDWTPGNAGGEYGGSYSMQGALAHSVNTVSVQLIMEMGVENVVKKAHELGVTADLPKVPSIVLGTADVNMVDMMKVYSAFANGGHSIEPYIITKVEDFKGQVLYEHEAYESKQVIDSEDADVLIQMLKNGTEFGSGQRIKRYGLPVHIAGKTGTTQNQSDGWFIGASPNLVAGAWVGTDDRRIHFRNLATGSGGRTALPLVGQLFHKAYANKRIKPIPFDTSNFVLTCPDYSEMDAAEMNEWRVAQLERRDNRLLEVLENVFTGDGRPEAEEEEDRPRRKKSTRTRRKKKEKLSLKERLEKIFGDG
ncbi:transglycosylase domain-containing protein [Portibacter lacus]|uniref:Penicillin-binding protein 1A n=1 Tax=Portibacter lacus TaxID=1099794 RepID=A0AA37WCT3_9BACT|nr:transglycosylase domain-containing protein [Portibacter lacus]GLR16841.1 penicillin-binding protein 1A [Portibacter lacus]